MTDGQIYFLAAAILAATTWKRNAKFITILALIIMSNFSGGTKAPERTPEVVERPTLST